MEGEDGEPSQSDAPLAAHEAMGITGRESEGTATDFDGAARVGAAQQDDEAAERPVGNCGGKRRAAGSGIEPQHVLGVVRVQKGGAAGAQLGRVAVLPAVPDLRLPEGVEALDVVLKTLLARRRKHRDNAEAEAVMDEPAEVRGMGVCALKNGVVVERRISGQTPTPYDEQRYLAALLRHGSPLTTALQKTG